MGMGMTRMTRNAIASVVTVILALACILIAALACAPFMEVYRFMQGG